LGNAALLAQWNEIKHRTSPQYNPNNSKLRRKKKWRRRSMFGDDNSEDEDK
jgi:hypothetical protein